MKIILSAVCCVTLFACNNPAPNKNAVAQDSLESTYDWALLPFKKVDSANPVLMPGINNFLCPVRKENVAWEQKDVFNPAIVVRHDTLFMLYRAQDTDRRLITGYAGLIPGCTKCCVDPLRPPR